MGYVPEQYKLIQTSKETGGNKKSSAHGSIKQDKKSNKNNYEQYHNEGDDDDMGSQRQGSQYNYDYQSGRAGDMATAYTQSNYYESDMSQRSQPRGKGNKDEQHSMSGKGGYDKEYASSHRNVYQG